MKILTKTFGYSVSSYDACICGLDKYRSGLSSVPEFTDEQGSFRILFLFKRS